MLALCGLGYVSGCHIILTSGYVPIDDQGVPKFPVYLIVLISSQGDSLWLHVVPHYPDDDQGVNFLCTLLFNN